MILDRLLCGLATPFDQPSRNGDDGWSAEAFARWLELESSLSMRVQHAGIYQRAQAMLTADGRVQMWPGVEHTSIGRWSRFAAVTTGSTPAGMLALGEVDTGVVGDSIFASVKAGTLSGLSIGAWRSTDDGSELVVPYEVSLTTSPAHEQALIIGTGRAALHVFEMLSGQRVEVSA